MAAMRPPVVDWPEILRLGLSASMSGEAGSLDARLMATKGILDRRFAEPWTVSVLARQAGLSREGFIRAFRAAYGQTPHQYLLDRRLEEARRMLESTDRSVTEVCFEVGFSSLGSFSATFHRRVGAPPSRFRRRWTSVPGDLGILVPCCFLRRVGGVEPSLFEKRRPRGLG